MNTVIIGKPVKVQIDIKAVIVPECSFEDFLAQAGYCDVNQEILKVENFICNPGTRYIGVWCPYQVISSEDADRSMQQMSTIIDGKNYIGRSATIEELISYEHMFHNDFKTTPLIVLGERVCGYEVTSRHIDNLKRRLDLGRWSDGWSKTARFLVVFEEVPKPE